MRFSVSQKGAFCIDIAAKCHRHKDSFTGGLSPAKTEDLCDRARPVCQACNDVDVTIVNSRSASSRNNFFSCYAGIGPRYGRYRIGLLGIGRQSRQPRFLSATVQFVNHENLPRSGVFVVVNTLNFNMGTIFAN